MFGRIAPRYDLLNHLLSFNLDKRWRARTVARVSEFWTSGCAACSTCAAEPATWPWRWSPVRERSVLASDFCHPMLVEARRKIDARGFRTPVFEADALALPLADDSLDLITIAFGFRNLANYQQRPARNVARAEARRSGRDPRILAAVQSPPSARYTVSSPRACCPGSEDRLGLARSIFLSARIHPQVSRRRRTGSGHARRRFSQVEFERMTGGAVALHIGHK